jgi:hypothetical protein
MHVPGAESHGFGRRHWSASAKIPEVAHRATTTRRQRHSIKMYVCGCKTIMKLATDALVNARAAMRRIWAE